MDPSPCAAVDRGRRRLDAPTAVAQTIAPARIAQRRSSPPLLRLELDSSRRHQPVHVIGQALEEVRNCPVFFVCEVPDGLAVRFALCFLTLFAPSPLLLVQSPANRVEAHRCAQPSNNLCPPD